MIVLRAGSRKLRYAESLPSPNEQPRNDVTSFRMFHNAAIQLLLLTKGRKNNEWRKTYAWHS